MKTSAKDQQEILQAAADLGRANGIALAAKVFAALLTEHKGRVVGTNEIKRLVADLRAEADTMRDQAKSTLNFYSIILNS